MTNLQIQSLNIGDKVVYRAQQWTLVDWQCVQGDSRCPANPILSNGKSKITVLPIWWNEICKPATV